MCDAAVILHDKQVHSLSLAHVPLYASVLSLKMKSGKSQAALEAYPGIQCLASRGQGLDREGDEFTYVAGSWLCSVCRHEKLARLRVLDDVRDWASEVSITSSTAKSITSSTVLTSIKVWC